MIPRMRASRASRRACRTLVAGCIALLALAAAAPAADAPSPTVVKDAKDAVAGALDLTRAQLGLASDRRVRIALTLAAPWQPKDLLAREGPPGSLCVRLWTVTKPGATPPATRARRAPLVAREAGMSKIMTARAAGIGRCKSPLSGPRSSHGRDRAPRTTARRP